MTRPPPRKLPFLARHHSRSACLRSAWFQLVARGFSLLYDSLAWAYDAVSWTASLGRWRDWQLTSLQFIRPTGRVLELASGPGHLLVALRHAGHSAVGLDVSRGMVRLAGHRLQSSNLPPAVCLGDAARLPFPSESFDTSVVTFPTPFIYKVITHSEVARVLKPHGRLIVVEHAWFAGRRPSHRIVEWLYRITGQQGSAPDLCGALRKAGFSAQKQTIPVQSSQVSLIIADRIPSRALGCSVHPTPAAQEKR